MLPLFALFRRITEPTPFLTSFFPPPEIFLFWGTSIAITSSGTQKALPTPVGRKYSIGSSLLTSSPSMTLTYLLFTLVPLVVTSPLTHPLLPLLSPYLAPGGGSGPALLITYQFYQPSFFLRSFAPTNVPHPSIFRKLFEMTLPITLTRSVLLQRNTRVFLFLLLLLLLSSLL